MRGKHNITTLAPHMDLSWWVLAQLYIEDMGLEETTYLMWAHRVLYNPRVQSRVVQNYGTNRSRAEVYADEC